MVHLYPMVVIFCGTVCLPGLYIPRSFPLGSMVLFVVPTFLLYGYSMLNRYKRQNELLSPQR